MKPLHLLITELLMVISLFFACQKSGEQDHAMPAPGDAGTISVAVAGNFTTPFKEIARRFEEQTSIHVIPAFGSTGKLYAQIRNGAPFDAFFAADMNRPLRLEENDLIIPGSRITYAVGKLVLWSPDTTINPEKVLKSGKFERLAIANPVLAPYGEAAEQVLTSQGLLDRYQDRLIRGENISQAFQFVSTGNADLGFVALSQLQIPGNPASGSSWLVPQSLYKPIVQQAVLLTYKDDAKKFMDFVTSPEIKALIQEYGYTTP